MFNSWPVQHNFKPSFAIMLVQCWTKIMEMMLGKKQDVSILFTRVNNVSLNKKMVKLARKRWKWYWTSKEWGNSIEESVCAVFFHKQKNRVRQGKRDWNNVKFLSILTGLTLFWALFVVGPVLYISNLFCWFCCIQS